MVLFLAFKVASIVTYWYYLVVLETDPRSFTLGSRHFSFSADDGVEKINRAPWETLPSCFLILPPPPSTVCYDRNCMELRAQTLVAEWRKKNRYKNRTKFLKIVQAYAYYGGKFDDAFHARENCYNVRLTACACPSISERKMTCWLKNSYRAI